jgi:hypothetical protein
LFVDYRRAIALATVTKDVTVTAKTNLDWMQEAADRIMNDPVKLTEFMRKVMGPPRRTLEGDEREHMLTVLRLIEPISSSNNQRSFTEEYEHAGKKYDVHYFEGETVVEEYLEDDI